MQTSVFMSFWTPNRPPEQFINCTQKKKSNLPKPFLSSSLVQGNDQFPENNSKIFQSAGGRLSDSSAVSTPPCPRCWVLLRSGGQLYRPVIVWCSDMLRGSRYGAQLTEPPLWLVCVGRLQLAVMLLAPLLAWLTDHKPLKLRLTNESNPQFWPHLQRFPFKTAHWSLFVRHNVRSPQMFVYVS